MILTNEEIYEIFLDETNEIFGFGSIKRKYKFSKIEIAVMKEQFYAEFDKETHEIHKIVLKQKHKFIVKNRKVPDSLKFPSEELKQKRANGIRKFWKENEDTEHGIEVREISRQNMLKLQESGVNQTESARQNRVESRRNNGKPWHSEETKELISANQIGKIISEETKQKQSESAIKKFESGWRRPDFKHTPETLKRLSEITTQLWKDGVFTKSEHLFNSLGQQDLHRILNQFIYPNVTIEPNKLNFSKSWDSYIEELKIIFEYNGTYWHYDPRFYEAEYFEEGRNLFVSDVWNRDLKKKNIAIENGFKFFTVWQYDWELLKTDEEKVNFINQLVKE